MSDAPPPRAATATSTIPPRRQNIPPSKEAPTKQIARPESVPSPHAQAVIDIIDYCIQIPLASMAAVQTMRMPNVDGETFVSAYAMDAYAVEIHKRPLADGIADLAKNYPVLGALLDKISLVAPAGGLLTVCMTLAAQLMENHSVPGPFSAMPGVVSRNDLAAGLVSAGQKVASSNGNE